MVAVTILAEVIMVLICLHGVCKQKLRLDIYTVAVVGIIWGIYLLVNTHKIPPICGGIVYLLLGVYTRLRFKQNLKNAVVKTVLALSLAVIFEVIVAGIANVFQDIMDGNTMMMVSSLCSLLLCCVSVKGIPTIIKGIQITNIRGFLCGSLFFVIAFAVVLINYHQNKAPIHLYAASIMIFIWVVYIYIYRLEQSKNELEKKNLELELQQVYGGMYTELLENVRKRQHDYKNQLSAIYSMHMVANSLEELITMQKAYGDTLADNGKFDSVLTCCRNPILAGYIYHKCITCEKAGIEVSYHIYLEEVQCCFGLHEVIEMLGILIDNACEYLLSEKEEEKSIQLNFWEEPGKIIFSVSNPSKYLTGPEIEKIFQKGYSSKGKERGIGLPRVLELVKEHHTEITVMNIEKAGCNWIDFSVNAIKTEMLPRK